MSLTYRELRQIISSWSEEKIDEKITIFNEQNDEFLQVVTFGFGSDVDNEMLDKRLTLVNLSDI